MDIRTLAGFREQLLDLSSRVLTPDVVTTVIEPTIDDVLSRGNAGVISIGFLIALWAGSRALNVFVDTITIMYGMAGKRGIVRTRALSFVLYLVFLVAGIVLLPLILAGPSLVGRVLPSGFEFIGSLYWPVVLLGSVCMLATLYHLSVPARTRWRPICRRGHHCGHVGRRKRALAPRSQQVRREPDHLRPAGCPPIAFLIWLYVISIAVLIGAALNSGVDDTFPGFQASIMMLQALKAFPDQRREERATSYPRRRTRRRRVKIPLIGRRSHILRNDLIRSRSLAECWSVRIAPETIRAWPLPARPALSPPASDLGFDCAALRPRPDRVDDVSLPRCVIRGPQPPAWQSSPKPARPARAASENEDTHMTTETAARRPARAAQPLYDRREPVRDVEGRRAVGARLPRAPESQRAVQEGRQPAQRPCSHRKHLRETRLRIHRSGDLRGASGGMASTQRRPGIDGGKTATLEPWELDDEYFMLRIRIDGGALTEQLRVIGQISVDFARDTADVTDRQNVQLHWIRIEDVPEIWRRLEAVGLSTTEACGDCPRVILGSPVAGIAADEIIDPTPAIGHR